MSPMIKIPKDLRLVAFIWLVLIPLLALIAVAVANYSINSTIHDLKVVPYGY